MAQITHKQALDKSAGWLADEPGMTVGEDGNVTVDGTPPLVLTLTTDGERLVISHVREEAGVGAARADMVMHAVPDRGTSLHVSAAVAKTGLTFTFTNPVYLDGFSRQALVSAVNELVSTVDQIDDASGAPTGVREPAPDPVDVAAESVEPDSGITGSNDTAETTEVTAVSAASTGWAPTHRVPAGGLRAWDEPDPSLQPSSRLEPRVELQIAERKGDWARGVGSNGWSGWIDARKLEEMKPTSAGGTIDLGGIKLRPLPAIAAAALALASFLPWLSIGGGIGQGAGVTTNSFDIALSFLWDYTAAGSPYLGFALLALAAAALFMATVAKPNPGLVRLLGVITIAITTLFVVQMYRGVTEGGGTIGDVFDFLGFAVWVAIGAGVALLTAARR
jgi:hypothetical protein